MAFRLKRNRSMSAELGRLVKKQLQQAHEELAAPEAGDEAIHKARTSLKKVRAVLRLLKSELGPDYRDSNRRLRKAADLLSGLRDSDATLETLAAVRARYQAVLAHRAVQAVGAALGARKRRARASAGRAIGVAVDELRRASRRMPARVRENANVPAVTSGLVDGYRRARKAMEDLRLDSDDTSFHTWRKRVKDHWYHVRLFEGLHQGARSRARRLEELETLLGIEHNLVVLRSTLLAGEQHVADSRTTALLFGCMTKYQAWLRQRTVRLGHRMFNAPPATIAKSVKAWWKGE